MFMFKKAQSRISAIEKKAERNFANFSNSYSGGYNVAPGGGYGSAYRYAYADAAAAAVETVPANRRTLTITVENSNTSTAQEVVLFNSIEDLTDANKSASITITVLQAPGNSHVSLKTELLSNCYYILGCKYIVETAAQLNNEWTPGFADSSGHTETDSITPQSYGSAQNEQTLRVDMADFEFEANGKTSLTLNVNASETIQMVFYVKGKVVPSNIAKGIPVREATNVPPPTGIMPFDLVQRMQQPPGARAVLQG